ncbi:MULTISPECIES: fimbrial protein [Enterobacter]|jgi:type 1 fimbria pilin|uniref:Type 1 fimbrial protein n=1 Tax=Enterobacter asburiae TaxID=61645 RepID=A0A8I1G2I5_ENTAS|nr:MULTISPECIES: fimbrial protein [Enterobacter]QLO45656.1 type 1 fimbrial protein [Enterobacter cloacae]AHW96255.1 fimbrial protein [Enterobacter asburiae L1]ELV3464919.1 type 1 fimbrial protein [Enterobacter asburiae]ELZ5052383.1 type 1 fimbrial protein [Enterobacter asburiae]EMB6147613.1 type 1 fimbrial protein [Enterobacter asburiae]
MKAQFNNKTLLAIAIAALLPAGTALAAGTSGGTVNFSGKVVTSACAISAGSANIDVDMGEVRTATLATAGSVASTAKAFAITLEDCEIADTSASTDENPIAATTVAVTFTGTPDTSDVNSLSVGANGSANSAQNVAIRLYDEQGNVVNLGEPAAAIPLRKGANTLNFSAKYYSPKGGATAGDASAVATYTVTYS